jgi:predicted polyphosphate/ATP-dependent NAD kinase
LPTQSEKNSLPNIDNEIPVKTIGFIVNPIAGMGGAVGLKGTDGLDILQKAVSLGAKPIAPARAEVFLSEFESVKKIVQFVVGPGRMGENEAQNCGFTCKVLGERKEATTNKDTVEIAGKIKGAGADLLIFCGGDGTARDILEAVNLTLPVLGVPTGVKMHSAVFAVGPRAAARIAVQFIVGELPLKEAEVMDVDEQAFRRGRVSAKLYGYALTPYEPHLIQGMKMASLTTESEMRNQAAMALFIIENMKPNVIYIIGPGTTTRTIGDLLDAEKTLLGVDLFYNKKLIAKDVNEKQILQKIKGKMVQIIVTPIGGQGFIFGRGNQQISREVILEVGLDNIIVVATEDKLRNLKSLRVDTGDSSLDDIFRGHPIKVITDYQTERVVPVE